MPNTCGDFNDTTHWILLQKLNNWANQIHDTYQQFNDVDNENLECQCSILQFIAEFSVSCLPKLSALNETIKSHSSQDPPYGCCDVSLFTTYQMELQAKEINLQSFKEISPFFQLLKDQKHLLEATRVSYSLLV